jgi:hypothetical protein
MLESAPTLPAQDMSPVSVVEQGMSRMPLEFTGIDGKMILDDSPNLRKLPG